MTHQNSYAEEVRRLRNGGLVHHDEIVSLGMDGETCYATLKMAAKYGICPGTHINEPTFTIIGTDIDDHKGQNRSESTLCHAF